MNLLLNVVSFLRPNNHHATRAEGEPETLLLHDVAWNHADVRFVMRRLADQGVLRWEGQRCPHVYHDGRKCEQEMVVVDSATHKSDGVCLDCPVHGGHFSIRRGSFFAGRHLRLSTLAHIFHLLNRGLAINTIADMHAQARVNRETVSNILRALQKRMWADLCENHRPTFTPGDELEIDEMWMDWEQWERRVGEDVSAEEEAKDVEKRRAAWRRGRWVLGMVNRARTKLWIECIPNRSEASIRKVVDPTLRGWLRRRPRIHTDAHKGYDYLAAANTHYVINKKRDGFGIIERTFWGNAVHVNVNAIENVWRHLRAHLAMRYAYSSPQLTQLNIAEFVYTWNKLSWIDLIRV